MKKHKPGRIFVSDILEEKKEDIEIQRSYGGVLFVGHFALSEKDCRKLVDYIRDTWPKLSSGETK